MHKSSGAALGVGSILLASVFSAGAGAAIYYARSLDQGFSPLTGMFIRVLANVPCIALAVLWRGEKPSLRSWKDGRELWAWGVFGALTLASYFSSVLIVGAGTATLVNIASGVLIAGFAPFFTAQRASRVHVGAALASLAGMWLLSWPVLNDSSSRMGLLLALLSGVFGGVAYLVVARTGRRFSPETVVLHWTVLNAVLIGTVLLAMHSAWPVHGYAWWALISGGLCMALAQYLTTVAYQNAAASLVACLGFLGPLLNVLVDVLLFDMPIGGAGLSGAVIVIVCGLVVPLLVKSG